MQEPCEKDSRLKIPTNKETEGSRIPPIQEERQSVCKEEAHLWKWRDVGKAERDRLIDRWGLLFRPVCHLAEQQGQAGHIFLKNRQETVKHLVRHKRLICCFRDMGLATVKGHGQQDQHSLDGELPEWDGIPRKDGMGCPTGSAPQAQDLHTLILELPFLPYHKVPVVRCVPGKTAFCPTVRVWALIAFPLGFVFYNFFIIILV